MFRVIGIAGPARCGKDTAADHIISMRPAYLKSAFADPMKTMLHVGFELDNHQLFGAEKDQVDERYGCTPRHMLQTLGTEWGRNLIGSDIWVKAVETHMAGIGGTFIIPDVRFNNEASFVREHGQLIHVLDRGKAIDSEHVSEQGVNSMPIDFFLFNDEGLDTYKARVYEVLRRIEFYWHKGGM